MIDDTQMDPIIEGEEETPMPIIEGDDAGVAPEAAPAEETGDEEGEDAA